MKQQVEAALQSALNAHQAKALILNANNRI